MTNSARAVLTGIIGGLLLLPAAAPAATVRVTGGVLVFEAEPGERNDFDIDSEESDPGQIHVFEYGNTLTPGAGCVPDPSAAPMMQTALLCVGADAGARVELLDGDDTVFAGRLLVPLELRGGPGVDSVYAGAAADDVDGGPGADELWGGRGADRIAGGDGDDTLDGDGGRDVVDGQITEYLDQPGADALAGGNGDDVLRGNGGPDTLEGGSGEDTLDYSTRRRPVVIDLAAGGSAGETGEGDVIVGGAEVLLGGSGADTVRGGPLPETIRSGGGDDVVEPGEGADVVDSGEGTDAVAARDGAVDRIECGPGIPDRVTADHTDVVARDCDAVELPAAVAVPQPAEAPRPQITFAARAVGRMVVVTGRATSCAGAIRVQLRVGRKQVGRSAPVASDCTFRTRLRRPRSTGAARVRASGPGVTTRWMRVRSPGRADRKGSGAPRFI